MRTNKIHDRLTAKLTEGRAIEKNLYAILAEANDLEPERRASLQASLEALQNEALGRQFILSLTFLYIEFTKTTKNNIHTRLAQCYDETSNLLKVFPKTSSSTPVLPTVCTPFITSYLFRMIAPPVMNINRQPQEKDEFKSNLRSSTSRK